MTVIPRASSTVASPARTAAVASTSTTRPSSTTTARPSASSPASGSSTAALRSTIRPLSRVRSLRSVPAWSPTGYPAPMDVSVGTFNLNNLFSRFNFEAQVDEIVEDDPDSGLTATYTFNDPERFRLRTYQGRLVRGKNPADQDTIGARIAAMDLDVLCAQEVEDIDTLRFFAARHLDGRYRYLVLVEGNDPRLIDLAVLSRLPLGAVASHQHAVHPEDPAEAVFSRDLLEVDILHPTNGSRLFTVFNNHLKSQFVPFGQDPVAGKEASDTRRRRQAETVERLVAARTRPDSRYLILGDMNDPPDAPSLAAIAASEQLQLVNGLDPPLQGSRPAGPLRAVRPDLAEPLPGRPPDRRLHRPPHPPRRRRQRPRPLLGHPHPLSDRREVRRCPSSSTTPSSGCATSTSRPPSWPRSSGSGRRSPMGRSWSCRSTTTSPWTSPTTTARRIPSTTRSWSAR